MKFKVIYFNYSETIVILKEFSDGSTSTIADIVRHSVTNEHSLRIRAPKWKEFKEFLDNYDLLSINMIGVSTKMLYKQLLQLGLEEHK